MPLRTPTSEMSGAPRVAAAVDVAPQGLDAERIGAVDVAREHVLDHPHDGLRPEGRAIHLADALDAVVGDELQEDEVAAAEMGRGSCRRRMS